MPVFHSVVQMRIQQQPAGLFSTVFTVAPGNIREKGGSPRTEAISNHHIIFHLKGKEM